MLIQMSSMSMAFSMGRICQRSTSILLGLEGSIHQHAWRLDLSMERVAVQHYHSSNLAFVELHLPDFSFSFSVGLEALDWKGNRGRGSESDLEDEHAPVDAEALEWLDDEGDCWTVRERRSMGIEAALYCESARGAGRRG